MPCIIIKRKLRSKKLLHHSFFIKDTKHHVAKETVTNTIPKLKNIFWEGTEHWETLLNDRAEISGRLVLSDFTKDAIAKFKSGG